MSELAHARLEQATAALASKKGLMEKLDFGSRHLRLFVGLGTGVSEVSIHLYFVSMPFQLLYSSTTSLKRSFPLSRSFLR